VKWKKRKAEIRRLRRKNPTVRAVAMPELKCSGPHYPSLSATGVAKISERRRQEAPPLTVPDVFVGTPHKQGPMLMFREELAHGGGKKT
jgi:hypothetical protein